MPGGRAEGAAEALACVFSGRAEWCLSAPVLSLPRTQHRQMHSVLKEWGDNALRPSNGQPAKSLSPQELRKQCRAQGETGRGQQTDLNWPQPSEPRDPGQLRYNFSIILTDVEALSRGAHSSIIIEEGTGSHCPRSTGARAPPCGLTWGIMALKLDCVFATGQTHQWYGIS